MATQDYSLLNMIPFEHVIQYEKFKEIHAYTSDEIIENRKLEKNLFLFTIFKNSFLYVTCDCCILMSICIVFE
ncbi:unnamed protein product [Rotaria socialis]|uniref:Uncharacterized protein n=1 Tax=Rotaria socialis TaxID=392032 RepID=A0A817PV00_9BILA|nr:unnamed protein product [Rotaria socialis]CAF3524616.1 unnamed protein product [Rotaria socialis]CAF3582377.1 unnamed protein product [Rotaria socialis]CAF3738849.1 unnamed protein product [Rotaria socialis]